MTNQAFFIAGTDTGVGKTYVSALLAQLALQQGQRVAYYKPVQTGIPEGELPEDPAFVVEANAAYDALTVANRYCFSLPAAPAAADPQREIAFEVVTQDIAYQRTVSEVLLVEGAGGLMVPMTAEELLLDWLEAWKVPVILVARSALGTMNHTLLSVEALRTRDIPLHAVVFNQYPDNLATVSDPSIPSLLETLQPFLPENVPVWQVMTAPSPFGHHTLPASWTARPLQEVG